ncbi:MAG: hypothetical protein JRG97_07395 [Deltaproteobacteria bacterium]|nr:hypothetical protein [Deltaproteobacteria bacterium]MBW2052055.1 hypothetical protein [Deltaproteobacteria bacterium]MBW2140882.1 hypothetical protein [Deltaproteobacteria bacterium]MBW2322095.1 hypothetical protein [Deltaproteobacteria bacterium]
MSKKVTKIELLVVAVAHTINDGDKVVLGVGAPMLAGALAKALHAPNAVLMMESGMVDFEPLLPPRHVADVMCLKGFPYSTDLFNTFTTITYRGYVDKTILGVGQVDKYGNVNTSFMGGGPTTGMRLTGAGGAPDFMSYAKETILCLKGGKFVEELDYHTSPGYLGGGDERDRSGLFPQGSGPSMLISPDGIFRFDPETKEMYLESVIPGVTVEEVKARVPWDLKTLDPLKEYPVPKKEETDFLRSFAPYASFPNSIMMELAMQHYTQEEQRKAG